MAQNELNADIEAGKFTPESIANARLSPELEQRLWNILVADPKLGPKFHKLLIRNRTAEERLILIRQVYPTKLTLYTWVRNVIGVVAEEDPDVADKLAAVLKRNSEQVVNENDACNGEVTPGPSGLRHPTYTETPLASLAAPEAIKDLDPQLQPLRTPPEDIEHHLSTSWESVRDLTWIDEYGLPLPLQADGYPINDGMNETCTLASREEAEDKLAFLSRIYGGQVKRWNLDDHRAGMYGDPNDKSTRSETGWIVQRPLSAHAAFHEYERQPREVGEQLPGQWQGRREPSLSQLRERTILLSRDEMPLLLIDPQLLESMPDPDILAPLVHEPEGDDILMLEYDGSIVPLEFVRPQSTRHPQMAMTSTEINDQQPAHSGSPPLIHLRQTGEHLSLSEDDEGLVVEFWQLQNQRTADRRNTRGDRRQQKQIRTKSEERQEREEEAKRFV